MRNKHCQLTEKISKVTKRQTFFGNHHCMFMQCFLEIKLADIRLISFEHVTFVRNFGGSMYL